MVDVETNWRKSDGGVFSYPEFGRALSNNPLPILEPAQLPNSPKQLPFVLLGDDTFALTDNFKRPYPNLDEKHFDYRFSVVEFTVVENFGQQIWWAPETYCIANRKGSKDFLSVLLSTQLFTEKPATNILH
ncbi:hypothetical protein JTB14_011372 [Gonioctena quinquepunctata]|nr:hypothetical protein JTB14_011372 [Gonioctena quinquepunctata]